MIGEVSSTEGAGLRAEQARKRKFWIITVLTIIGALAIAAIMTVSRIASGTPLGHMPPAAAIAGALLFPAVTFASNWAMFRAADELDRIDQFRAYTAGFHVFLFGTWAWISLNMGGLVPPPNVLALFIGSGAAFLLVYYGLKLRR